MIPQIIPKRFPKIFPKREPNNSLKYTHKYPSALKVIFLYFFDFFQNYQAALMTLKKKNEKILFFHLFVRNTLFHAIFFHKKIDGILMPFFAQNCKKNSKSHFKYCNFDTILNIFHSKIAWLGVAPNFSVFFCEFRPAGCLALTRQTACGPKRAKKQ